MTSPDQPPADAGVPTYVLPPAVPGPPPRRWLVVVTVVWTLVLAGAALWYVWKGAPTDREQTTIGSAKVTADRMAADVVVAAGPGVVVDVAGFDRVGSCRISAIRPGVRRSRAITLFAAPGSEARLLETVAAGLPAGYHATVAGAPDAARLRADGGNYVALTGAAVAPGEVRLTVDTGCRQRAGDVAEPTDPPPAQRAAVADVLTALGSPPVTWRSAVVTCPNGSPLWTVAATGSAERLNRPLNESLAAIARGPVTATPERVAWRGAGLAQWARSVDGVLTVGATGAC